MGGNSLKRFSHAKAQRRKACRDPGIVLCGFLCAFAPLREKNSLEAAK
jgi:hypothetical protein